MCIRDRDQVVQRDRHAQFVSTLAGIGASLEKFATEIEIALVRPDEEADSQNPRLALWRKALGDSTGKKAKAADVASDFASATGLDGLKWLVSRLVSAPDDAAAANAWKQASEQWRHAHTQRNRKNRADFKVLADVGRDGWPKYWVIEGDHLDSVGNGITRWRSEACSLGLNGKL